MPTPGPLVLPIGAGLKINGNKITDHNRGVISITPNRIEKRSRMANGTLRNFTVASKDEIKTSWDNVPFADNRTVDGYWGMAGLSSFYSTSFNELTLTITYGDNSHKDYTVMFKSFSYTLKKRSRYVDLYSFDASWEEV